MKKLEEYFESTKGPGVLATADNSGRVDAAIYSRPHFLEEGTLAFIMRDRLTRHNLQSNPHATFLFMEDGQGYNGKRLFLKKVREENNPKLIRKIKRRKYTDENKGPKFLVYFTMDKELPLIVPITLLNHYVRKFGEPYLKQQVYLNPHPIALKLRNHA